MAVAGAGPAGSFFAMNLLRKARETGRTIDLVIIERKRHLNISDTAGSAALLEGCNCCAGGLSPRMCDILDDMQLELPEEVIQSRVTSITVQGHWKNVELAVPPERRMLSVFRGSKPAGRLDRTGSFDAFLLEKAVEEGAVLVTGDVHEIGYSDTARPLVHYDTGTEKKTLEVDFLVIATGVSQVAAMQHHESNLLGSLQEMMPGFTPPSLRRAIICELRVPEQTLAQMQGEVYFIEYGSADLRLEMCSIIPKAEFVTVVLIGPGIDRIEGHAERLEAVNRFLALPHVRKLLPGPHSLSCTCSPHMVMGDAGTAIADRVAVIGDLATSRLNKDGIYSAYETSRALANTLLTHGADRLSLSRAYWPGVKAISRDNLFGRAVFLLHRITFSTPVLSRVLYQAIFTERKTRTSPHRRLERILWSIASGDASYRYILGLMLHPSTIWSISIGGLLVTIRNYLAELLFGLKWRNLGRHTTGVYREQFGTKRRQFIKIILQAGIKLPRRRDIEKMYTIKIKAPGEIIFERLGHFGNEERGYFRPRFVDVRRIQGEPNREGSIIRYSVTPGFLSFNLMLVGSIERHQLIYRVLDGFAQGGVLMFEIEPLGNGQCGLSIYVTFDLSNGTGSLSKFTLSIFRLLFPAFLHDVIWNHSLCQLKDCIENQTCS